MKKLLAVLVLVALGLAGLAWWLSQPRNSAVREELFTYLTIDRHNLVETVSATGSLQPPRIVLVTSQAAGQVVEVCSDVNQMVHAGQVLARVDQRQPKLKLDEASQAVATARIVIDQAIILRDTAERWWEYQKDISRSGGYRGERENAEGKFKAAQAGVRLAAARLEEAQVQQQEASLALEQTQIKVPGVSGDYFVLERNLQVGQMVGPQPGPFLFKLAGDLSRMEVHTEVVEGDIGKVRKNLPAIFTLSSSADPERRYLGKVREIRPVPTTLKGAVYYNAVIEVQNDRLPGSDDWRLRPGMTASVDIILRERANAWRVPLRALNFRMDEAYQTSAARQRVAEWKKRPDAADWRTVWVWQQAEQRVWPVFIRIENRNHGEIGIQDADYHEILDWETGQEPRDSLRIIVDAPPPRAPAWWDRPLGIKLT